MKLDRRTIATVILVLSALVPMGLVSWLMFSRETTASPWTIAAVASPLLFLLAIVVALPVLLRPIAPRAKRETSPLWRATTIAAVMLGFAMTVLGAFRGNTWIMAAGGLLAPLLYMIREPPPASGMKPGQFTLRRLFFITTLLAVLIGMLVAIDRWKNNSIRENNERAARERHEIAVKGLHDRQELLESYRGKISPEAYEQRKKELDEEAAKLDLP
jgi:hypothetical protein